MPRFVVNGVTPTQVVPPTPRNWRVNTETLTGNKTLTDDSPAIQLLDGGSADRDVNLPSPATSNPLFSITNNGFYLLSVINSNGLKLFDINPGSSIRIISDGTKWVVGSSEKHAITITGQSYHFGGNPPTGNFFVANQVALGGGVRTSSNLTGAYHVIHEDGVIDEISWLTAAETASEIVILYINDVAQEPSNVVGGGGAASGGTGNHRYSMPISVSKGDRIAIEADTGTAEMVVSVRVRNTTNTGYMLQFGGDPTANNAYYTLADNYNNNTSSTTANQDHEIVLLGTGDLVSIAYAIDNATTSDSLIVEINGTPEATIPLKNGSLISSTLVGVETLDPTFGVSFTEGDTLTLKAPSSTLGDSVISILTNVEGNAYQFKGNPGVRDCFRAWSGSRTDAGVAFTDNDARVHIRHTGTVAISWNTQNFPTGELLIIKNMNETVSFDWFVGTGAGQQGVAHIPMTVVPGDTLSICTRTGGEGNSNLLLVVG